mmetsp:Transcript_29828/g.76993  ORF Transcript_29828/g.76993 Transcript_29828/m.76993 type:complete len:563 (-) Transcript_29828:1-1689(-)
MGGKIKSNSSDSDASAGIASVSDIEDAAIHVRPVVSASLLPWFEQNQRQMDWRDRGREGDAYAVWVSEIMLQQTRVAAVREYYTKWMKRFPTVADLAEAELDEVNQLWSGLGYYRRAKFLHEGAKEVVEKHGGVMPHSYNDLIQLKGIGDYTASAIASIVGKEKAAVVDGNVIRVLSRCLAIGDDINPSLREAGNNRGEKDKGQKQRSRSTQTLDAFLSQSKKSGGSAAIKRQDEQSQPSCSSSHSVEKEVKVHRVGPIPVQKAIKHFKAAAQAWIEGVEEPGEHNQAVMELGAIVCTPKSPTCDACPLKEVCSARSLELQGRIESVMVFPPKAEKVKQRKEEIDVFVVNYSQQKGSGKKGENKNDEVLLSKRPSSGLLGGLWEFPNLPITDPPTLDKERDEKRRGKATRQSRVVALFKQWWQTNCAESLPAKLKIEVDENVASTVFTFSHILMTSRIHSVWLSEGKKPGLEVVEKRDKAEGGGGGSEGLKWAGRGELGKVGLPKMMQEVWDAYAEAAGVGVPGDATGGKERGKKRQSRSKATVEMEQPSIVSAMTAAKRRK